MFKVYAGEGSINKVREKDVGNIPFKPIQTLGNKIKSLLKGGRRKKK